MRKGEEYVSRRHPGRRVYQLAYASDLLRPHTEQIVGDDHGLGRAVVEE